MESGRKSTPTKPSLKICWYYIRIVPILFSASNKLIRCTLGSDYRLLTYTHTKYTDLDDTEIYVVYWYRVPEAVVEVSTAY
jgi:hypothetical protein